MEKIVVIADDITGAAEMAGIAHRFGLRVQLFMATGTTRQLPVPSPNTDILVLATDTRSMTEAEAVAETRRICKEMKRLRSKEVKDSCSSPLQSSNPILQFFKKTDSALRGHVVAELETLLACTDYERALYIPANPSKGRTIRNGVYYINGVPIANTDFSFDPEFPAHTSSLADRFPEMQTLNLKPQTSNLHYTDTTNIDDIRKAINDAGENTLLAGAADLFTCFLEKRGLTPLPLQPSTFNLQTSNLKPQTSNLIICGSTQSKVLDIDIPVCPMPLDVYDGAASTENWVALLNTTRATHPSLSLILTIPYRHRTGKEIAVHLRNTIAEVTKNLVETRMPHQLIIEGGATAYQILNTLGWNEFEITHEIAPGVIRMQVQHPSPNPPHPIFVTLKPGSYDWGPLF